MNLSRNFCIFLQKELINSFKFYQVKVRDSFYAMKRLHGYINTMLSYMRTEIHVKIFFRFNIEYDPASSRTGL
jgi:hypothetical protein